MSDANPMPAPRMNAAAVAKAQTAWQLRVGGAPWGKIAAHVGYSDDAGAIRAVRNYANTLPQADRDSSRELWRARLEVLWLKAWVDVTEQRPGAVRAATAVAQRAAQLDGLDEPTTVALYSPDAQEYAAVLARMRELDRDARGLQPAGVEADIFSEQYLQSEVVEVVGVEPAAPAEAP